MAGDWAEGNGDESERGPETRSEDIVVDGERVTDGHKTERGQGDNADSRLDEEHIATEEGDNTVTASSGASELESNAKGKKAKRPRLTGEALRDELMRREREEKEAVLEVNTAFYRARAYKLIDDLKEVWDENEQSDCVRAGGTCMKGFFTISKLHDVEFALARKVEKRGQRPFKILNVNAQVCGNLAWVTCVEDMRHPLKPKPSTVQLVTNVFRKTTEGWKMIRHHASHKGPETLEGQLGKTQSEGAGELLMDNDLRASKIAEIRRHISSRTARRNTEDDHDEEDENDEEELDEDKQRERGILDRDESLKQRIRDAFARSGVMAQDVIINSVDDVRRQDPVEREQAAAEVASRIKTYLLKNKLITPEAARAEDERIKAIKARLSADTSGSSGDSGGVDGVEEDGEGSDRAEGGEGEPELEGASVPLAREAGHSRHEDKDEEDSSESKGVTRETVKAIRELARSGKITEDEKRLLLADVIRNASGGRHSTVEVAYEVLVGGDNERSFDPEKSDEFTEQCKVHAAQLAEEHRRSKRRWWNFWRKWWNLLARR